MFRLAAPRVPTSGIVGALHIANPPDACSPLVKPTGERANTAASFVLVQRGQCNFESKVRTAQEAGYKAVIVYNDQDDHELITSTFPYIFLCQCCSFAHEFESVEQYAIAFVLFSISLTGFIWTNVEV